MTTPLVSAENFPSPVKVPERVLVVDGEPLVRWALTASLSAAGYEVVTASTGDDACEIAGRTHPAVVLLDLRPQDTHGQAFFDDDFAILVFPFDTNRKRHDVSRSLAAILHKFSSFNWRLDLE